MLGILILAGVVVAFLLVVLVIQASIARLILQDIRGTNMLNSNTKIDNDATSDTLVRSYGLIVDVTTAASMKSRAPSQRGYALCSESNEGSSASLQPVHYEVTWFPVKNTPSAARLQQDVSSGKVSTMMMNNTVVKIWLASWPTDATPVGGTILFVVAHVSQYKPDVANYVPFVVVPPMLTNSEASWPQVRALLTNQQADLPLLVWAF